MSGVGISVSLCATLRTREAEDKLEDGYNVESEAVVQETLEGLDESSWQSRASATHARCPEHASRSFA